MYSLPTMLLCASGALRILSEVVIGPAGSRGILGPGPLLFLKLRELCNALHTCVW